MATTSQLAHRAQPSDGHAGTSAAITHLRWWHLAALVAAVAFLARLLPVLRGGGLHGIGHYDAAVYFGSAVGLVHGRLPYRDFLLLHPPGVTVALAPFAALGLAVGDANAMAVARVAWMVLGALNALLVGRILRPLGWTAALLGSLFYAVFLPAITIEQTTRLEAIPSTCLLGAIALLTASRAGVDVPASAATWAGALLGVSAAMKIWGVVPLAVVAVYLLATAGIRRAGPFTLGAAVGGTVVCLPFLIAAPGQMWRYVVIDQLDRAHSATPLITRLADITGVGLLANRIDSAAPLLVCVTVAAFAAGGVLAWTVARVRLAVVLFAGFALLLLATPSWFRHYAGAIAAPAAVVFGAAASVMLHRATASGRRWKALVVGLLVIGVSASTMQLGLAQFGDRFPRKRMSAAVAGVPGCVTADDPSTLIAMDILTRNLQRGCPLSLDLGGYSYDLRPPGQWPVRRERNELWQRHALAYLSSGSVTLVTRYNTRFGLSKASDATIKSWPVIYQVGKYRLRKPTR